MLLTQYHKRSFDFYDDIHGFCNIFSSYNFRRKDSLCDSFMLNSHYWQKYESFSTNNSYHMEEIIEAIK